MLACCMFIAAKVRLDAGFNDAQAKLADMAGGGLLGRASGGAYDEWQAARKYSEVLWRRLRRLTWPTVATRRARRVICR